MRLSLVFAKVFDKMPRRLLLKSLERTQAPADLITLIMFTATQAEPTAENICPAHATPVSRAEVSASDEPTQAFHSEDTIAICRKRGSQTSCEAPA